MRYYDVIQGAVILALANIKFLEVQEPFYKKVPGGRRHRLETHDVADSFDATIDEEIGDSA
jgi:hypothetical protein